MPLPVRRRVAGLAALHTQFEKVEEAHLEKLRALEISFDADLKDIFRRRAEFVSGAAEPDDEEVRAAPFYDDLGGALEGGGSEATAAESPVGVPLFWPIAMRYCGSLHDIEGFEISEKDWAVLEHLEEVRSEPWEPTAEMSAEMSAQMREQMGEAGEDQQELVDLYESDPGYVLHFRFAEGNPHLESNELSLYCYGHGEVADATLPTWKAGQDVTRRLRVKKMKKKRGGVEKQQVSKPVDSFFRIFAVPASEFEADADGWEGGAPSGGAEQGADGLLSVSDLQDELVARIKEDLVPRAALYYINALRGAGADAEDEEFWENEEK